MFARVLCVVSVVLLATLLPALNSSAGDHLKSLELRDVHVGGEIGRRIEITARNNLLKLDVDREFLAPFRAQPRKGAYIGLGKTIDAAVRLAACTNDPAVLARKRQLVAGALAAQEPDGYLGTLPPADRIWKLWDIHEMVYLVYGLVSDFRYFGEKASLAGARRLADCLIARWSAEPQRLPGNGQITLHMAVTGTEPAMLALFAATGDRRYLDFAARFRKLPEWEDRIVVGRHGQIEGHAYAHMCRCVAQLRLYRLEPDERLLGPAHRVIGFLTCRDGMVISGACGDHECWHDSQEGTVNLGETCATAYFLRLADELLRMEGNPLYGDLMERAIHNALFGAQSPDGRQIRYYTPMEGPRSYWKGDTYCCPCNYRRIIPELPTMVYYTGQQGVLVNLYTPSEATLTLGDGQKVRLRQETDYPRDGKVSLQVDPQQPAKFAVRLRIPRWCRDPRVTVNGEAAEGTPSPGEFFAIDRLWKPGDRVTLDLPMTWRLVQGRKAQSGRVAVMRGPLVFTLNRSKHPQLANVNLRLLVLKTDSLEGPFPDDAVIPGGLVCRAQAWGPGEWYPFSKPKFQLTLSQFVDPGAEATYFVVPNPREKCLVADELVGRE